MKTHTTTTLRTLIVKEMNPNNKMTVQEIETWTMVLPVITEELANQIVFFAQSIFDNSLVKRQLQQMQTECTFLLNSVDRYTELEGSMLALKVSIIDCLDTTLDKLINYYCRYADLSMNMSNIHFKARTSKITTQLEIIVGMLNQYKVESELKKIVIKCIKDFVRKKSASYQTVTYIMELQLDLINLLPTLRTNYLKEELCHYLYSVHFNTDEFIAFLKKGYKTDLEKIDNIYDQEILLFRIRQELPKLKPTAKKPVFLRQSDTIYNRLIRFIDTEIECLRIAIKKATPLHIAINAPVPVPYRPVDYKLRFNFSVDCLAYLIRLMVDANVIDPGVKSEMQRYIATNFQTPGTSANGIAPGSFVTKYKNVTQATSITVKTGLMAMIKLIDKNF